VRTSLWQRVALLAALVMAVALALGAAGTTRAVGAQNTSVSLDIELAFDSTGSMQPLIARAQKDAQSIIDAVRAFDPDARFAVTAFTDPGYPAPEYQALQPLTNDTDAVKAALGRLQAVSTDFPGNVGSEGYNLMFERSVTDASLGWRATSRKVVVVFGDAEPHNVGGLGIRGCENTDPDPHGLNTVDVLAKMRAAGRTLLMIRQTPADATLECYSSIATLAAPGSAARDAGSANLVGPIKALLAGTVVTLESSSGFPLALPGTTRRIALRIGNAGGGPGTLKTLTMRLPADASFISAKGGLGSPVVRKGKLIWTPARALASGQFVPVTVQVRVGSKIGARVFATTLETSLANGATVSTKAAPRLRVGRSLQVRIQSSDARRPAGGSVLLVYAPSASSLLGSTAARGDVEFGAKASLVTVAEISRARVSAAGSDLAVTIKGTVISSKRSACKAGTMVSVRLIDRDAVKPRSRPDLIRMIGGGCTTGAAGDVIIR
jgi:hypothetical protein